MSRNRAVLILACLALLLVWGLLPSSTPPARRLPPPNKGDARFNMSVIERLRSGEEYYMALGSELRKDDYPARSVFNWRTPLHFSLVAKLSVPVATSLLKLLVLGAVLATFAVLARLGSSAAVLGTAAQMGALATAFRPDAVGVAEIWAGLCVALSACAYYRRYWVAGALIAAAALFMRELAAPYCLVCAMLALGSRRRETAVWIGVGVAYAAYYALHVWQVTAHQLEGDLSHVQSWQQWNGIRFTLSTMGVNGWLGFLPRWMTVVYLVLGLAGTFSHRMVVQARIALLTYFLLFAFVGLPFNYYWGFVTAPLWAFGLAHAMDGLRTLLATTHARPRTGGPAEAASRP